MCRDLVFALVVAEGVDGRLWVGPSRIVNDDGVRQAWGKWAALVGRFDVADAFESVFEVYFHIVGRRKVRSPQRMRRLQFKRADSVVHDRSPLDVSTGL